MKRKLSKKGKKFVTFIIIVLLVLFTFVYFKSNTTNSKPSEKKQSTTVKKTKEEKKINIIDLDSKSRPYAVMINNISTVWGYQCSLEDAYIVYEIIVEGGYTRLMALFKDKNLDRIGSVRSSRHYFLDYALENDAIYVHFGWSPQAESDMSALGVNNINFMSYNGYVRDTSLGLATEHTAFTSTEKIRGGANYYGYRTESSESSLLNYSADSIDLSKYENATLANSVYLQYSNARSTSFEYDAESKTYKRFQNDIPHEDYITNSQYSAKNIITYQVANYTISGDNKGRQTLENIGNGTGWYISEGYAVPITWEKTSRQSKTIYKFEDGKTLKVNDGNTYIEIQPKDQVLTIN